MISTTQTLSDRFDPKTLAALEGLDFKARYIMEGFLSGLHESPFHGFSVEFSDYRNYQPGDDLRQLESLRPAGGARLAKLLQHAVRLVHRRSVILFFSDLLEPSEEVALGFKQLRFHGHECIIFQILDRDETEFPFTEPQIFEDLETGSRRVVTPAAAREKYLSRFTDFMEGYRELFRSLEMSHCVVRTDENPWSALAMFLAERKR